MSKLKKNDKTIANAVGIAPLGYPHTKNISTKSTVNVGADDPVRPTFEEHTKNAPEANSNPNSKIKTLYSDLKGITLIALIITIIVMLILVGVTINIALNGRLFEKAKTATEQTQKEVDREQLFLAVVGSMNNDGIIDFDQLDKTMQDLGWTGSNGAYTSPSQNSFEVDEYGNITGPIERVVDEYAGDISKGGKYDGSEDKPFQVACIEDLVAFSIMTNGGNNDLGLKSNNFSGKDVILTRTLDFKSIFSYNDYTETKYGDLNKDGTVEDIKTELTKTEEGCIGFLPINGFKGTFDGKENTIQNIYMYNNINYKSLALFIGGKNIKNLRISGTIINNTWHAAGISSGEGNPNISNCINYADITGYNMVGGIVDWCNVEIIDCKNYGTITRTGAAYAYASSGGIIGFASSGKVERCINYGDVSDGGIVGGGTNTSLTVVSCGNYGRASSGIISFIRGGECKLLNCYNVGECNCGLVGNFSGAAWSAVLELTIANSYNLGKVKDAGLVGTQGNVCKEITLNIENCYNAGESDKAIIGTILKYQSTNTVTNIKNTYYERAKSNSIGATSEGITAIEIKDNSKFIEENLNKNIGTNERWKHWKMGEDGYPIFD